MVGFFTRSFSMLCIFFLFSCEEDEPFQDLSYTVKGLICLYKARCEVKTRNFLEIYSSKRSLAKVDWSFQLLLAIDNWKISPWSVLWSWVTTTFGTIVFCWSQGWRKEMYKSFDLLPILTYHLYCNGPPTKSEKKINSENWLGGQKWNPQIAYF